MTFIGFSIEMNYHDFIGILSGFYEETKTSQDVLGSQEVLGSRHNLQ